jgi:hypothetical protein
MSAVLLTRADGSLLVACDALLDASEDRVAFIFRVKQSGWIALNLCVTCCVLAGNVALMLCDFKCLPGYSRRELEFSCISSGK